MPKPNKIKPDARNLKKLTKLNILRPFSALSKTRCKCKRNNLRSKECVILPRPLMIYTSALIWARNSSINGILPHPLASNLRLMQINKSNFSLKSTTALLPLKLKKILRIVINSLLNMILSMEMLALSNLFKRMESSMNSLTLSNATLKPELLNKLNFATNNLKSPLRRLLKKLLDLNLTLLKTKSMLQLTSWTATWTLKIPSNSLDALNSRLNLWELNPPHSNTLPVPNTSEMLRNLTLSAHQLRLSHKKSNALKWLTVSKKNGSVPSLYSSATMKLKK